MSDEFNIIIYIKNSLIQRIPKPATKSIMYFYIGSCMVCSLFPVSKV